MFDTARAQCLLQRASLGNKADLQKKKPVQLLSSLETLISTLLGVKIDKFFQLADWRIRPLPRAMLNYARLDSHYLIPLYRMLSERLNKERDAEGNWLVLLAVECNSLLSKRICKNKNKKVKLRLDSE